MTEPEQPQKPLIENIVASWNEEYAKKDIVTEEGYYGQMQWLIQKR